MKKPNPEEEKLLIYGIYCKIINNEKHYTTLQAKYKTLAVYWLLIIFAAIGLIFSSKEAALPFDPILATFTISIIGMIGIGIIWYEDVICKERILNINHLTALQLEKKYKWIPHVHHKYVCYYSHKTLLKYKVSFFIGCNGILYSIMLFSSGFFLANFSFMLFSIIILAGLIVFLLFTKFMFVKSYKNELSSLKEYLND
jgi:hypothetical protein